MKGYIDIFMPLGFALTFKLMALFHTGFGLSKTVLDRRLSPQFLCSALLEFGCLVVTVQIYSYSLWYSLQGAVNLLDYVKT